MRTVSAVLAAVLLAGSASALSLSDLTVGTTVSGPNLALKDLKNKIVYVVYWGTR